MPSASSVLTFRNFSIPHPGTLLDLCPEKSLHSNSSLSICVVWRRESILHAPTPRPTYALSLLVPSCLLSISEVASPGPGFSTSFPPPGRVWLKVTAVIPYSLPRGCRCRTVLSAAGFVFHSLLFLGILCSIKPSACNTAGRAPSRSSRLPFLSASASCLLRDLTLPLLLLTVSLLG